MGHVIGKATAGGYLGKKMKGSAWWRGAWGHQLKGRATETMGRKAKSSRGASAWYHKDDQTGVKRNLEGEESEHVVSGREQGRGSPPVTEKGKGKRQENRTTIGSVIVAIRYVRKKKPGGQQTHGDEVLLKEVIIDVKNTTPAKRGADVRKNIEYRGKEKKHSPYQKEDRRLTPTKAGKEGGRPPGGPA